MKLPARHNVLQLSHDSELEISHLDTRLKGGELTNLNQLSKETLVLEIPCLVSINISPKKDFGA